MIDSEVSLGYILLAVAFGFALWIFFLLHLRQKLQTKNMQMDPETVWKSVLNQALVLNLSPSNMLYGVLQDISSTEISLIFKDVNNQIVGRLNRKTLQGKRTLTIENETFVIEYPKTWKRSAILRSSKDESILARYSETNWLGEHEFDIKGYGTLKAKRRSIDLKVSYDYIMANKTIGTGQKIYKFREIGRVVVLPDDLPLAVKIFILSGP